MIWIMYKILHYFSRKSKSPRKMSAKTEKSPTEEISQRVSRTESEIISGKSDVTRLFCV